MDEARELRIVWFPSPQDTEMCSVKGKSKVSRTKCAARSLTISLIKPNVAWAGGALLNSIATHFMVCESRVISGESSDTGTRSEYLINKWSALTPPAAFLLL